MQLVIDIPDKIYEMVMNTGTYGYYHFVSTKAIREGVPLDKIRAEIKEQHSGCGLINDGLDIALSIIDKYSAESEDTDASSD